MKIVLGVNSVSNLKKEIYCCKISQIYLINTSYDMRKSRVNLNKSNSKCNSSRLSDPSKSNRIKKIRQQVISSNCKRLIITWNKLVPNR